MKHITLKRKIPLKSHKHINRISKKRLEESKEYFDLVTRLRIICDNKSELSGANPGWESEFIVDPHHIDGRNGAKYLDPFNLVLLCRDEHRAITEHKSEYTKEQLLGIVYKIRIKQGFEYEK